LVILPIGNKSEQKKIGKRLKAVDEDAEKEVISMRTPSKITTLILIACLLAALTSGCLSGPATETNPTKNNSSDTTSESEQIDFGISVTPLTLNGFSIPGQRCVFLVTIQDTSQSSSSPVTIDAEATNAEVSIENENILQNEVAEVTVVPDTGSEGKTVTVNFTAARGDITKDTTVAFEVIEGMDDRKETAVELKQKFVAWLAETQPELGITDKTEWVGTMVSPQWLVVSHYLFFSDEWEMHIEWHIMIAPDDWARIDLRRRFEEVSPSKAFEITSREADDVPISIMVPETVWR
jgi:hypothetical protein